jgi:hypothetical protein
MGIGADEDVVGMDFECCVVVDNDMVVECGI